jgi:hypothetical protein
MDEGPASHSARRGPQSVRLCSGGGVRSWDLTVTESARTTQAAAREAGQAGPLAWCASPPDHPPTPVRPSRCASQFRRPRRRRSGWRRCCASSPASSTPRERRSRPVCSRSRWSTGYAASCVDDGPLANEGGWRAAAQVCVKNSFVISSYQRLVAEGRLKLQPQVLYLMRTKVQPPQ